MCRECLTLPTVTSGADSSRPVEIRCLDHRRQNRTGEPRTRLPGRQVYGCPSTLHRAQATTLGDVGGIEPPALVNHQLGHLDHVRRARLYDMNTVVVEASKAVWLEGCPGSQATPRPDVSPPREADPG